MKGKIIDKSVSLDECIIVCGDKNAEEADIECPLFIDGINLEDIPCYIKIENPSGKVYKGLLQSKKMGDKMLIKWKIGSEVTSICGKVKCQIVFEKADGQLIMNTLPFLIEVKGGVNEASDKILLEINHITQLQNQLQQKIEELNKILSSANYIKKGDSIGLLNNNLNFISKESADSSYATKISCNSKCSCYRFSSGASFVNGALQNNYNFSGGDFVRIENEKYPLIICGEKKFSNIQYNFTTDEKLISDLVSNSILQIGNYTFSLAQSMIYSLPVATKNDAGKTIIVDSNGNWKIS